MRGTPVDLVRGTLVHMPRVVRKIPDTPEVRALDAVAARYNDLESQLEKLRQELKDAVIAAVRSGLSKSEAARKSGYTREYVSRLVSDANKADQAS